MTTRDILRKDRAMLRLSMLAGFKPVPKIDIIEIPAERSLFPGKLDDYWQKIERSKDDNETACLYEMGPKGVFNTHVHETKNETIELLTPGTKVEFITEDDIYYYEYPEVFTVPKNVMHALVSLVPFKIHFNVIWDGVMVGWEGDFINQKEFNK